MAHQTNMDKCIPDSSYQKRLPALPGEASDEILRYLAHIASDVTSGKLDPAAVNWRYIRSQISDLLHH